MNDQDKTKDQLTAELAALRRRVVEQDAQLARSRQAEADQRQINNSLPVLVATAGFDGYYKEVNAAFERILGWSEQESLSRPFMEFIHRDDRPAAVETFERLKSGETVTDFLDRNVCKDGSHRWINWVVIPVPSRGIVFGIGQDVTVRARSEQALRESERRYRLLAESLPHPVWRCDGDGGLIECNRRWYEYTGQTPEEATGSGWMKALHPEDVTRVTARVREDAAAGQSCQTEYRLRRASDGDYRWHVARTIPMKDDKGRIVCWFGSAADVHDQKETQAELERRVEERTAELTAANEELRREVEQRRQTEEALRASEERFRVAFEEAPAGMVMGVGDGIIVRANRAVCKMSGYSPEELKGRHVREFSHPEDRDLSAPLVKKLLAGEIPSFTLERRYITKDGHVFWAQATTAAVRGPNGDLDFALGIVEDITQRKQAQEALQQSYDELRAIYDGMIEGLLITDIATKRFVRANAPMCRMLGYSMDELLAASVQDIHPPEEVPNDLRRFQAAAEGRVSMNEERPVLRKDGSIFYADISGHPIIHEGRPCLLALFRDVTDRKHAQEALEQRRRRLLYMLRASDHERRTIAYDIHDGLTQQLAAAIMQFQTYEHLKDYAPGKAETAYAAGVAMVQQAHAEARLLISGVRPPALDEAGVAVAIAHLVHDQREPKGPQIEYHDDVVFDRLPVILENAVYRIAQEAVTNACQHSQSEKVRVSLVQEGDLLHLEVQDWGVGFDPESVDENHFGLEGIRERTRLLGGSCSIQSERGKGTRVGVTLPILERE